MAQFIAAALLVGHGLITAGIGFGSVTKPDAPAIALPSWFGWWPGPFGRSWLIDGLHAGTAGSIAGGALWLVAGVALLAAGLGWLGVGPFSQAWQGFALAGAALGLVVLALYFHPLYLVAVVINLAVLVLLAPGLRTAV